MDKINNSLNIIPQKDKNGFILELNQKSDSSLFTFHLLIKKEDLLNIKNSIEKAILISEEKNV